MITSRFSQRGQGTVTPMSIAVFFLLYFTFIQVLVFMVEGIVPTFLTTQGILLAVGSAGLVLAAMATAFILEKAGSALFGTPAPVSAWHVIHFAILGAIALNVGWPLFNAVLQSAMFTSWLIAIFIILPFIAFSIAMYQIVMGSGGG